MPRRFLFSIALAVAGLTSTEAWAGPYDLNLSRLGSLQGGVPQGDNTAFRTLSSELGTVMAPTIADSADSLGLSAFAVSADLTINTITPENWSGATQSDSPRGTAPSLQIMGRKGLWPGLEIGAGAKHLFDSRMWAMGGFSQGGPFSAVIESPDTRCWNMPEETCTLRCSLPSGWSFASSQRRCPDEDFELVTKERAEQLARLA